MITHVQLALLPEDLQQLVLAKYRVALMDPAHRLTYEEAAWLYGYRKDTLRALVCRKRLRALRRGPYRLITHAAMRAYLRGKKKEGTPRKGLRAQQLQVA